MLAQHRCPRFFFACMTCFAAPEAFGFTPFFNFGSKPRNNADLAGSLQPLACLALLTVNIAHDGAPVGQEHAIIDDLLVDHVYGLVASAILQGLPLVQPV